jgi:hypothetical protein
MGDFKVVGDELYNIRADPYEKKDLAREMPERLRALKARLTALATERRTPEPHNQIASGPKLALYGEAENKAGVPEWVKELVAASDTDPNSQANKKAAKKAKKKL